MNELLITMAEDMNINRFDNETDDSFIYRLCYSALGVWCLSVAKNRNSDFIGTTKHNQTIILKELTRKFTELYPNLSQFFDEDRIDDFTIHIRTVYEETGYLLTSDENHNVLANYGRSIFFGKNALFFGLPNFGGEKYCLNGFGIFTSETNYVISLKEFLIRDTLTTEEFFQNQFDELDFETLEINEHELEFFDPLSQKSPAQSWERKMKTKCTMARNKEQHMYYKVIDYDGRNIYVNEAREQLTRDKFISYEYRRLYFALKEHYNNPLRAIVKKIDNTYSEIRLMGHLPNREYYCMLLLSWPKNDIFDKTNFLVKTEFLSKIVCMLKNIGIKMEE